MPSSSPWAPGSSSPARTSASAAGGPATSALLGELGFDARPVPLVEGVSSSRIRQLAAAGEVDKAAKLLGRPVEVEGTVVAGDARGGTLGFPTANLAVPSDLLVPAFGIYAGEALGMRTATSIGVNPHYGGEERRVEAFLLDYEGDLYGRRLVVELWERLREERAFELGGRPDRADRPRRRGRQGSRAPRVGRKFPHFAGSGSAWEKTTVKTCVIWQESSACAAWAAAPPT